MATATKEAGAKDAADVRKIIESIDCGEYRFEVLQKADQSIYLIARYNERDIATGDKSIQSTRKWYISPWATKSEIVQTAFKCVMTSMEHRAREMFRYDGKRVFGPHFDVDALHKICQDRNNLDFRPPHKQDGAED